VLTTFFEGEDGKVKALQLRPRRCDKMQPIPGTSSS
jgi:hypothetical protein